MTNLEKTENACRYHVRLFPPVGEGEKYYCDSISELGSSLKRIYDKFKLDELTNTNEWFQQWRKDPLTFFCEHVQVTTINKEICSKHKKLFR